MPTIAQLLPTKAAAEYLGISTKTLRGLVSEGKLKYVLLGKRKMSFDPADLQQLIEDSKRQAPSCPSTSQKARRTGTTTSSTKVYDIMAVLASKKKPPPKR